MVWPGASFRAWGLFRDGPKHAKCALHHEYSRHPKGSLASLAHLKNHVRSLAISVVSLVSLLSRSPVLFSLKKVISKPSNLLNKVRRRVLTMRWLASPKRNTHQKSRAASILPQMRRRKTLFLADWNSPLERSPRTEATK